MTVLDDAYITAGMQCKIQNDPHICDQLEAWFVEIYDELLQSYPEVEGSTISLGNNIYEYICNGVNKDQV